MYVLGQRQVNGPVLWEKRPALWVATSIAVLPQRVVNSCPNQRKEGIKDSPI